MNIETGELSMTSSTAFGFLREKEIRSGLKVIRYSRGWAVEVQLCIT